MVIAKLMIEEKDIVNDLNIGRVIFENVPDNLKPFWSGLILSRFNNYLKNTPDSINELYPILRYFDPYNLESYLKKISNIF